MTDLLNKLCELTNTEPNEWEPVDGPSSRVGVDYYFVHDSGKACYINNDQDWLTVVVDGDVVFNGEFD